MKVENIALKDGQKEVVINRLKAELFDYPRTEKARPIEVIEIDLEKELMMWTCFTNGGESSVTKYFPWELEVGEKADVKEALFQIYEVV